MALKIGTIQADITADTSGLDEANRAIKKTGKTAEDAFKKIDSSAKVASRGMGGMNRVAGQLGFQLQDVAVQAQMGTNAMVILGQQGSQVASVFGPGGAVLGAIIAVGSAIAGSLLPSLFKTKDALEDMEEAGKAVDLILTEAAHGGVTVFTEKMAELARTSKDAVGVEINAAVIKLKASMKELGKEGAKELTSDFDFLKSSLQRVAKEMGITVEQALALRDALMTFRQDPSADNAAALQALIDRGAAVGDVSDKYIEAASAFRVYSSGIVKSKKDIDELLETEEKISEVLKKTTSAATAAARERAALREKARADAKRQRDESTLEGFGDLNEGALGKIARVAEERRTFILTQDQLTADARAELMAEVNLKELTDTDAHLAKLESAKTAATDRQSMIAVQQQQATLQGLSMLAENTNAVLSAAGQEGTAIMKAIVLAQRAIQVASILAATEVAAANAGAVGSVGGVGGYLASAAGVRTMGYASAALVAGLAIGKTFQGGGRAMGGNVSASMAHPINERGTPEILTQGGRQFLLPTGAGGKIEPIKAGAGAQSANVTIISNGTPQTVTGTQITKGEIAVMIDDSNRRTKKEIAGQLATGRGDVGRALPRGFNVSRNLS